MGQVDSLGKMVAQHILPYFIKNVPIYGTLCLSSSIYHIVLDKESEGSRSGGPHRAPKKGYHTIEGQLGYRQNRMKQKSNQHHIEREFEVVDWVFLRLRPYK
jgi:hypothetical protein